VSPKPWEPASPLVETDGETGQPAFAKVIGAPTERPLTLARGGPTELLVNEEDIVAARRLLPKPDSHIREVATLCERALL
jgi:hypothetical protein